MSWTRSSVKNSMALRFLCRARHELGSDVPVMQHYAGKQSKRTITIGVLRHN